MKGIMARVREKNISIRVLFPLVFSVSVTVCIVALILFLLFRPYRESKTLKTKVRV